MRLMNVRWLIENAIFNDLHDGETKWQMFEEKFDHMSDAFIESISEFGIQATCVYDKDENVFYNGHHRLLVAWLLDIEFIPVADDDDDYESSDWGFEEKGWPGSRKGF